MQQSRCTLLLPPRPWNPITLQRHFLALRLSAFTMGAICLVIAPLSPSHDGEALLNRIGMQGQHNVK